MMLHRFSRSTRLVAKTLGAFYLVGTCGHLAVAAPAKAQSGRDIAIFKWSGGQVDGAFVLHPATGELRRLSSRAPSNFDWTTHAAWSPDRTQVAFEAGTEFRSEVYVATRRNGRVIRITHSARFDSHPSWSPNGRWIVEQRENLASGNSDIYVVPADGSGARTLLTPGSRRGEDPAWSPDGRWIAYEGNKGVFVVKPDGHSRRKLSSGLDFVDAPVWAPDAKRIAFVGYPTRGGAAHIYRVNKKGRGFKQLTHRDAHDQEVDWAPDGRRLLFVRETREGNKDTSRILTIKPDGTRRMVLTGDVGGRRDSFYFFPQWSPDSQRVAFRKARRGRWHISIMRRDGSGERSIIRGSSGVVYFGLGW